MATPTRPWQSYLYAIAFALAAWSVAVFANVGSIGGKEVGTALLAMVGTFVGAGFAFRLNEQKDAASQDKARRAALNRALFMISRQYNAIRVLQKQLQPFTHEFERAFNCPAFRPPPYEDLSVEFESLDFLLEQGDPNVLARLSVEQEGFHQAMASLRYRNDFYIAEVQPLITSLGFNRRSVPAEEFSAKVGELVFQSAVNYANIAFQRVAEAEGGLLAIQSELFASAKALYPDASFVKIAPEV